MLERMALSARPAGTGAARPQVTLAYAQSLDGCLTAVPGRALALSGPEAARYTHGLRAAHDAILVGIGTVLVDDPRLTVRHVAGSQPQPVVLDSLLRTPPRAALLAHPTRKVWLAHTAAAPPARKAALAERGARLLPLPAAADGRVHLPALLGELAALGVERLMVEGGAAVITAFLGLQLADRLSITLTPRLVGGVHAPQLPMDVRLEAVQVQSLGANLVIEGRPVYAPPA